MFVRGGGGGTSEREDNKRLDTLEKHNVACFQREDLAFYF